VGSGSEGALALVTTAGRSAERFFSAAAARLLLAGLAVTGKVRALAGLGDSLGESRCGYAGGFAALAGRGGQPKRERRDEEAGGEASGAEAAHRGARLNGSSLRVNRLDRG
jgi:hypothetical protein